jgi:hypothetical protein
MHIDFDHLGLLRCQRLLRKGRDPGAQDRPVACAVDVSLGRRVGVCNLSDEDSMTIPVVAPSMAAK